jgi:uncharacterized membrane protein YbhN (UPF0104 family)
VFVKVCDTYARSSRAVPAAPAPSPTVLTLIESLISRSLPADSRLEARRRTELKTGVRRTIGTIAAAAVGAWLLRRLPIDTLVASWRHVDATWLLCSAAASLAMVVVRSIKWSRLLVDSGQPRNVRGAVRSLLGSYALGTITPGRLGDLARCAFLPDAGRADVLQLTILDRTFDVTSVAAFGAVSIFLFLSKGGGILTLGAWAGICFWVSRNGLGSTVKLRWLPQRVRRFLGEFVHKLRGVRLERYLGWALVASSLELLTLCLLQRAFHTGHMAAAVVAYPLLTLATGLPISFGGLGPREGLSALIFATFSISAAAAVDISVLFFALTLLLPSVVGAAWILASGAASWAAAARRKISLIRRPESSFQPIEPN